MKAKVLLFVAAALIVAASCERTEEDPYEGQTRYTVLGKVPSLAANMIATATVYEYNAQDLRIDSSVISDPSSGTKYIFPANDSSTHLKVKLISKENTFRWGDTIIYLVPKKNVDVTISVTSPIRFTEPKPEDYQ